MAVPVVKGIQGQGVIACAKHYINNNQEQDRLYVPGLLVRQHVGGYLIQALCGCREVNAIVDERTEMEIYLPPFEVEPIGRRHSMHELRKGLLLLTC